MEQPSLYHKAGPRSGHFAIIQVFFNAMQSRHGALSKTVPDMPSIPAMSAEPERLFSGAKISITDRRNRLGIESIEALECFKVLDGYIGVNRFFFFSHLLIWEYIMI